MSMSDKIVCVPHEGRYSTTKAKAQTILSWQRYSLEARLTTLITQRPVGLAELRYTAWKHKDTALITCTTMPHDEDDSYTQEDPQVHSTTDIMLRTATR